MSLLLPPPSRKRRGGTIFSERFYDPGAARTAFPRPGGAPNDWPRACTPLAKHHKRRTLQPPLVQTLSKRLEPGGWLLLQTDVHELAVEMREMVREHAGAVLIDEVGMPCRACHPMDAHCSDFIAQDTGSSWHTQHGVPRSCLKHIMSPLLATGGRRGELGCRQAAGASRTHDRARASLLRAWAADLSLSVPKKGGHALVVASLVSRPRPPRTRRLSFGLGWRRGGSVGKTRERITAPLAYILRAALQKHSVAAFELRACACHELPWARPERRAEPRGVRASEARCSKVHGPSGGALRSMDDE
eukprot:scaffold92634_cov29-Tisochrysis_lutea.AAC.4